jgi:hypothetical protein
MLGCGHHVAMTADTLRENQWYIGRRVECEACRQEEKLADVG